MAKYAQQKVRINIPRGYSPEQRIAIGEAIVEFIKYRTRQENVDKDNDSFAEYSDTYEDEKNSARVNLDRSGDMLANLKVLQTYVDYITIGYDKGYSGMGKVEGNRKGTYGNKAPVVEGRDFLGITEKDLNRILADFPKPSQRRATVQKTIQAEAKGLNKAQLRALGFGLGLFDDIPKLDKGGEQGVKEIDEDFDKFF